LWDGARNPVFSENRVSESLLARRAGFSTEVQVGQNLSVLIKMVVEETGFLKAIKT
jgi:hypothetical protein